MPPEKKSKSLGSWERSRSFLGSGLIEAFSLIIGESLEFPPSISWYVIAREDAREDSAWVVRNILRK